MPTTNRSGKHPSQCSWHRLQGRGKISFQSTSSKKTILQHFFCLQYKHRYIQTQALCCTNVLPPRSQCTAWHDYCSAADVFPYRIADIVYTGRNKEKETCGLERGLVPVPGCALQREFQRLSCSPASPWWLVNWECWPSFPHLSFHKLHGPSLAPGISFLQDVPRCPLPGISRAIRDVTALRQAWLFSSWATASLVKESQPTSVQSQTGKLKSPPVDGWQEIPGAWQNIWLLQQLATWLCGCSLNNPFLFFFNINFSSETQEHRKHQMTSELRCGSQHTQLLQTKY